MILSPLLRVQRYVTNILGNIVTDALFNYTKACVELESNHDSLPLAQRRPRRPRRLPARYRDLVPEPPRPLPPAEAQGNLGEVGPSNSCLPNASLPSPATSVSSRPKIKTQLNNFGLFRLYDTDSLPINDPDTDHLSGTTGLSSLRQENFTDGSKGIARPSNPFYPYPNETSLLLGDWYWNHGHQKSQTSFKKLLDIIGHPGYHPSDVRSTNWTAINQILGSSDIPDDKTKETFEWLDSGVGWKKTAVRICVPFHHRTQNPGPKEYIVEDFYHRSLVGIIRENVTDPTHHRLLHYEPYELRWQPPHKANDVRVYGELYTSENFLAAHRQLQNSPPELGCSLPRRIIGLMLWSDATHLTAFGTAKLWPLYVYMGNESKYVRCQPTSNLCSHAAYFHTVSHCFHFMTSTNYLNKQTAPRCIQGLRSGERGWDYTWRQPFHPLP